MSTCIFFQMRGFCSTRRGACGCASEVGRLTPRISVVVPTIGRDTLNAARESAAAADEVIVIYDKTGDHGYSARTRGMEEATGTHLAFLDDDDIYLPGAIDLMRDAACDVPVIFRMDHPQHGILWREPCLEFGNVGTPMILVPNVPGKLGRWESHIPELPEPGGDYRFLIGCCEAMGAPVWRSEVIARVRPHDRKTVAVVTPWQEHLELGPDYFRAIECGPKPDELIIVDDGSRVPLEFAACHIERSGFSRACNTGLEQVTADVVVFLNNDIEATTTGWLQQLTVAVEPGVLVGARMRWDEHGTVDGQQLPYLDGWCLAGMRDDLVELGGFDESYQEPAYYSDNDLCLRARAAGMTLREVRVGLRHKLNVTAGHGPNVTAASVANQKRFAARARELLVVAA